MGHICISLSGCLPKSRYKSESEENPKARESAFNGFRDEKNDHFKLDCIIPTGTDEAEGIKKFNEYVELLKNMSAGTLNEFYDKLKSIDTISLSEEEKEIYFRKSISKFHCFIHYNGDKLQRNGEPRFLDEGLFRIAFSKEIAEDRMCVMKNSLYPRFPHTSYHDLYPNFDYELITEHDKSQEPKEPKRK